MERTICLDFDGTLNTYDGWQGNNELFEPREGVEQFLHDLKVRGFRLAIHSTRPAMKIWGWLAHHGLKHYIDSVSDTKPVAWAYIDDRGIQFNGDFEETLKLVDNFTVFWEQKTSAGRASE